MKRVRLSTLLLLVVIAALSAALVARERRHATEVAALKSARFSPNVRYDSRFAPSR